MRMIIPVTLCAAACATSMPEPRASTPLEPSASFDGLLRVDVAADGSHIILTLPAPASDGVASRVLYANALRTGFGSAPIGLDRMVYGETQLLAFRRIGGKVVVQYENPRFRATGAPVAEQAAARDSFAVSTTWVGDVQSTNADGSFRVDITSFLTSDTAEIASAFQHDGIVDAKRIEAMCVADPASIKVFPDNIEIDAIQTYALSVAHKDKHSETWTEVTNIAPDSRQVSLTVHHSFVRLPAPGFQTRRYDQRVGGFGTQVIDFATPLGHDVVYELVNRFRLEKVDPTAARSPVKKPIVFYIDRSAPEPIRSALADGARWWAKAFDAAGFVDGFRVEIMPDDMDPLDIRYNVVHWVDRATRGWSFGQHIADPRTGEIIKGSVILGSLRIRQDIRIFEALVGAARVGKGGPNDPVEVALQRIRQLAAHEVGHSLGLVHNFAASSLGRTSVMDYPAPRITVKDGVPDLADAYGTGAGAWDLFAIDWLYADPTTGQDPDVAAREKSKSAIASGMRFISDADARSPATAQRWASMWDDGADPVRELERMMEVRRVAIEKFGLGALGPNEPIAELRRKFVPVWLLHRYQMDAAVKAIGGVDYTYAVNGDGEPPAAPAPAAQQRSALDALLATLEPRALTVPDKLVTLLSAASNNGGNRQSAIEVFSTAGSGVFDPLVAADAAAEVTLNGMLAPERLARLVRQHVLDAANLGLDELLDRLIAATVTNRQRDLGRRIAYRTIVALAATSKDPATTPEVAGAIDSRLHAIADSMQKPNRDSADTAWAQSMARVVLDAKQLEKLVAEHPRRTRVPPGMPIGGAEEDWMEAP